MKKNLIIFPSLWEGIKKLNNEQKGVLFSALCTKFFEGEEPVIEDEIVTFVYSFYSSAIAESMKKYEDICEKRAQARKQRITKTINEKQNSTKSNKSLQNSTKSNFVTHKEKEKDNEKDNEKINNTILADAVREFNTALSHRLPMVVTFNDKRKNKLSTRFKEFEQVGTPSEVWTALIDKIKNSKFLLGDTGEWKCSFDWLVDNSTNWLKVYEGHYNNNAPAGTGWQGAEYKASDWDNQ